MEPERLKQIESLIHQILALEPGERAVFLDEACAADLDLRAEVESLIARDLKPSNILVTADGAPIERVVSGHAGRSKTAGSTNAFVRGVH